jgi:hypothetical protein
MRRAALTNRPQEKNMMMKKDSNGNWVDSAGTVFQTQDGLAPVDQAKLTILTGTGTNKPGAFSNGQANTSGKAN